MNKPIAVLTADVHYNIQTLKLADAAIRMAINKANELKVPLIVAGDLHDTKANMRAECVNAIMETFKLAETKVVILVGNHDKVNEKSLDHSLNFLKWNCAIVENDEIYYYSEIGVYCIAYQSDLKVLRKGLSLVPKSSTLIMHQGLNGSDSGEYIQDHSALNHEDVKDFRVISGHYHRRQDIKTGPPREGAVGLWSYIGNPYTFNFGEAKDPEKGFQILMDDGTLEFVPTNLRKHVICEYDLNDDSSTGSSGPIINGDGVQDLMWVKIKGTKEHLGKIEKNKFLKDKGLPENCRFDLISTDSETRYSKKAQTMTQAEVLDDLIDSKVDLSDTKKQELKILWKKL